MRYKVVILFFVLIQFLGSCHFYKIGQLKQIDGDTVSIPIQAGDYLIIHLDNEYYHLTVSTYNEKEILGRLNEPSLEHDVYTINRNKPEKKVWRYSRKEKFPINEAHIYVSEITQTENGETIIEIDNIEKIEIYDEATGMTIATSVGIPVVSLTGGFFVFILIACACPQVYIAENEQWLYKGSLFPGAMSPKLERYDHKLLPDHFGDDDSYIIKIANENPETDYLDFLELEKVFHQPHEEVFKDRHGEISIIRERQKVESITLNEKPYLVNKDTPIILNNMDHLNGMNEVTFPLKVEDDKKDQLLLIEVKNTEWMDVMFHDFFALFGEEYERFKEKQSNQPTEKRIQWLKDQGVLLSVYIDNGNGWEYYDYFTIAGSMARRTLTMKLDASRINFSTKIKLSSGFNFWEFYSIETAEIISNRAESMTFSPSTVVDEDGISINPNLSKADLDYELVLLSGEEAHFYFDKPEMSNHGSLFLNTRGYYEYDFKFSGKAKKVQLRKFRKKEYFSRYSMERYKTKFNQENLIVHDKGTQDP